MADPTGKATETKYGRQPALKKTHLAERVARRVRRCEDRRGRSRKGKIEGRVLVGEGRSSNAP
jgi:hypothetical protein